MNVRSDDAGAAEARQQSHRPRPRPNKWLVTLSVTFGTLMGAIDASIINVAIPHLRGALGATVEEITWVTTAFVLATIVIMPLTAFLGRLYGQKRLYLFCLALFVAGSILCGCARSLAALTVFRVVQGLGAGALQPTEQTILRQTFPQREQGMAMALFGMAVMIGPAFGPTLGGFIIDSLSWPWIFFINVPIGLLALVMVHRFVHEPEDIAAHSRHMAAEQRQHMDWAGIVLLSVGLCALQFVLEEGQHHDWFDSQLIVLLSIVALIAIGGFVARELTARVPAVHLTLLADRVFLAGVLAGAVTWAMLMCLTFLLPVFMQEVLGFSATQTGMYLMPRSLVMCFATAIVGRLYNRISPRAFVTAGIVLFVVSAYQMSHFTLATSRSDIWATLIVQGLAFSCIFVPLTTLALSTTPRPRLSDASGLDLLICQIGGSAGLALFATLMSRFAAAARTSLSAHLVAGRPEVMARIAAMQQRLRAHGIWPRGARQQTTRMLADLVTHQAMVLSFERLFWLAGICFCAVLPLVMFLKQPQAEPQP